MKNEKKQSLKDRDSMLEVLSCEELMPLSRIKEILQEKDKSWDLEKVRTVSNYLIELKFATLEDPKIPRNIESNPTITRMLPVHIRITDAGLTIFQSGGLRFINSRQTAKSIWSKTNITINAIFITISIVLAIFQILSFFENSKLEKENAKLKKEISEIKKHQPTIPKQKPR